MANGTNDLDTKQGQKASVMLAGQSSEDDQALIEAPPSMDWYDNRDREAEHAIPAEWEAGQQITLDGLTPGELAQEDRRLYCQQILGNLSATFRALREQAQIARVRLWSDGQNDLPAMMETPKAETAEQARLHAIEAVSNWYYREGQGEKETVAYIGAISASPHTLNALYELNRLKKQFSEGLAELREALAPESKTRGDVYDLVAHINANALQNVTRKAAGALVRQLLHPKLNIRQVVRTIPIIDSFPYSVRWKWIESPSTLKIDRVKLLDLLERKQDNPEAQMDFQRVAGVTDPAFCLRKGVSVDLRVSVCLSESGRQPYSTGQPEKDSKKNDSRYVDIKSRLPIIYRQAPKGHYRSEPKLAVVPTNAPTRTRKKRVEDEPFLATMAVHRYIQVKP
ncbi:MAG: Uncharacterized protein AWU57_511 [Marinobacter sp. T13-3]|nr:MAG: Uncharacterized protein AWU57_511 [Marinobacter sp. T13-3]